MQFPREHTPRDARGPRRTCIGCRRVRLKADLVRLVRRPDGSVVRDATGPGRGAYVCADPTCVDRAMQRGRLAHAFKRASVPGPGLGGDRRNEQVRHERSY